jgi:hypothetical protein
MHIFFQAKTSLVLVMREKHSREELTRRSSTLGYKFSHGLRVKGDFKIERLTFEPEPDKLLPDVSISIRGKYLKHILQENFSVNNVADFLLLNH